jgi:hypothetical protein
VNRNLDLSIWREMGTVSIIRRFVEELYEQVFDDRDVVSRIALAAHELLENAVKYSYDGEARIRIGLAEHGTTTRVAIEVTNHATADDLRTLRTAIAEMDGAGDPLVHYQTLLRRSAKRRDGSGLGLARVVAEGEMSLALAVEEDRVSLRAEMVVEGGAS